MSSMAAITLCIFYTLLLLQLNNTSELSQFVKVIKMSKLIFLNIRINDLDPSSTTFPGYPSYNDLGFSELNIVTILFYLSFYMLDSCPIVITK